MTPADDRGDQLEGRGSTLLMSEQLARSLRVLSRRWWILVLLPVLALIVSLFVSESAAKSYTATAKLFLAPTNQVSTLISPGSQITPADPERDLNTEVSQITETPMATLVLRAIHSPESSTALLEQVSAALEGTTNIVDVKATDASPQRAAQIANAFAAQYVPYNLSIERSQYASALARAQSELSSLGPAGATGPTGTALAKDAQTLQATLAVLPSAAQVTEAATVPTSPSAPKPLVDALVAIVAGILVAIVAIILLELLDNSVEDEQEASEAAGIPSLGSIPRLPSGPIPLVLSRLPAGSAKRALSRVPLQRDLGEAEWEQLEGYNAIAVTLRALRPSPEANLLMITSAGPQDGKTTVTLRLAAALADLRHDVIAVECDMRRPQFAAQLQLPPSSSGLSTLLESDDPDPEPALIEIDSRTRRALTPSSPDTARSFRVLVAGPSPERPQALLGSDALPIVLRQLREQADVVLIDTPPLGLVNDGALVSGTVDQVLMVARAGHTDRDQLRGCRDALGRLGVDVVGLVTVGTRHASALGYYAHNARATHVTNVKQVAPVADSPTAASRSAASAAERRSSAAPEAGARRTRSATRRKTS